MMPVRLSVTEVHWRIIANLGFKFRSHFTTHCGRRAAVAAVLLAGESSRAMLASARLSCFSDSMMTEQQEACTLYRVFFSPICKTQFCVIQKTGPVEQKTDSSGSNSSMSRSLHLIPVCGSHVEYGMSQSATLQPNYTF